jgi:serine/threonine protein kinase
VSVCGYNHAAMAFPAETQIGPYKVVALIGSGGMGEVYRAHDTRLQRDVALKVLPASFTHDADRLRRFELEARRLRHSIIPILLRSLT